jgi:hypothetical protein
MDSEPPANNPPKTPPAEMLTPAEAEELTRAIGETTKLFQKLIERNRAQDKSKPPTNKPPAEMLTEAEQAQLTQERNEAQTLFQKLLARDRRRGKTKGGGRSR